MQFFMEKNSNKLVFAKNTVAVLYTDYLLIDWLIFNLILFY